MLFWTYWLMTVVVLGLVGMQLWRERDWRMQLSAALVLIPLVMRVFLIK